MQMLLFKVCIYCTILAGDGEQKQGQVMISQSLRSHVVLLHKASREIKIFLIRISPLSSHTHTHTVFLKYLFAPEILMSHSLFSLA